MANQMKQNKFNFFKEVYGNIGGVSPKKIQLLRKDPDFTEWEKLQHQRNIARSKTNLNRAGQHAFRLQKKLLVDDIARAVEFKARIKKLYEGTNAYSPMLRNIGASSIRRANAMINSARRRAENFNKKKEIANGCTGIK